MISFQNKVLVSSPGFENDYFGAIQYLNYCKITFLMGKMTVDYYLDVSIFEVNIQLVFVEYALDVIKWNVSPM